MNILPVACALYASGLLLMAGLALAHCVYLAWVPLATGQPYPRLSAVIFTAGVVLAASGICLLAIDALGMKP